MLGDAKQKLTRMVELAEELYESVNELKQRIANTTETVEETNDRIAHLESEMRAQRIILEAIADERGLDVELPPEYEGVQDTDGEAVPSREDPESDDPVDA